MGKIKISLVAAVFATEHLLRRSIVTWANQDFPKENFEIIIINDGALGDIKSIIEPYHDIINIQYIEFNHKLGMRGNTISLNTGWMCSRGEFIAETTPETLFLPDTIRTLYEAHEGAKNRFVMYKTYNLTSDMQLKIDTVDWKSDIMNISKLDGWNQEYVQLNKNKGSDWGTHQTDSIRKDTWYRITGGYGWPCFGGYGEDDPFCLGLREASGIEDCVVIDPLLIHQHHLPWNYFASLGHSPMTNKYNHSVMNVWNDVSGRIPNNGSAGIFDGGLSETMSEEEKLEWRKWDDYFLASGGDPKYLEPRFDYYKKYMY